MYSVAATRMTSNKVKNISTMKTSILFLIIFLISGCGGSSENTSFENTPPASSAPTPQTTTLYFPPNDSDEWEKTALSSLNWNTNKYEELIGYLQEDGTRAFIVLKDGKIVIEEYFGLTINGNNPFDATRNWYWASAGKTLTSFMVGIAQEQGYLSIEDSSSEYLGSGWASLSMQQEQAIKISHHLIMTTGLDDEVVDDDCTLSACLLFLAAPEQRWAYHNAPYTLLTQVVEGATQQSFEDFFTTHLKDKIGMNGFWFSAEDSYNETYYSTARSMARFGLLMLNNGKWIDNIVMQDTDYLNAMINSSQEINPAYGYLWWLNGKASFMVPAAGQASFNGAISPDAPADMYAAIGKSGQFINVIPSQNLVIVRMGESTDDARVAIRVQNNIWERLKPVISI